MIKRVLSRLSAWKRKREFKRNNAHNQTWLVGARDISCITVGNMTWGGIQVLDYMPAGSKDCQIHIGSYCSIAGDENLCGEVNTGSTGCPLSCLRTVSLWATGKI